MFGNTSNHALGTAAAWEQWVAAANGQWVAAAQEHWVAAVQGQEKTATWTLKMAATQALG